jgi:HPt (histidine-containing phosphotransfer) domain-containing protein
VPHLSGVDTSAGLALMVGDEVRYRHWLVDFVSEAPATMTQIRQALAAAMPQEASRAAHTLKGRSGMLGMNGLHVRAAALETAIDSVQQVETLLHALEQDVIAMCAEIRSKLCLVDNPAPALDVLPAALPPGLPPASVRSLIDRLQAGDSDCDRMIADCLIELMDTPWAPYLRQASIYISHFDYCAASELLTGKPQARDTSGSR